jgi:tryptophan halogenase
MSLSQLRRIVIVGGGSAGWMAAAALSKLLLRDNGREHWTVALIESEEIGTIGVGEGTIPAIKAFNSALGIGEDEFLRETKGTFKLGIEFTDWSALGSKYFHGFGDVGQPIDGIAFHHYWLRLRKAGLAHDYGEYSINSVAPLTGRFMRPRPDMARSPLSEIGHAFHFDASLYGAFLRKRAEQQGVVRTEGRIEEVLRNPQNGHIAGVRLSDGRVVDGDFFIDCSGQRALLIEQSCHAGFEDWSHWLPCDRAIAVPTESAGPLLPYTRSSARSAGWQWRIPLQHRIGNGHVYSSAFMPDAEAADVLLRNLDSEPLAEPRLIRFVTGRRKRTWIGNCVAIGLASGFVEPLESTSIHLVQSAITRLMDLFPHAGLDDADIAAYNRQTQFEIERIRDFIILHYYLTTRDDSPFWDYCRQMSIPDSLAEKIELFASNGRIFRIDTELFREASWAQVMLGQGLMPKGYHPVCDIHPLQRLQAFADDIRDVVRRCVDTMPMHEDFIAGCCQAQAVGRFGVAA